MAGSSQRSSVNTNLQTSLSRAELNAKKREMIDLDMMDAQEAKANASGHTIIKKKLHNRAAFVQIIRENYEYLQEIKYLTRAEKAFLLDLTILAELHTNAIADTKTGQFCSVSYIARTLDRDLSGTSDLVNALIQKCVLFEFADIYEIKEHGRNVTERPLFFNPEIICCGDRNKINPTLAKLVIQFDRLERSKILLPWKLSLEPHASFGKLVKRKRK